MLHLLPPPKRDLVDTLISCARLPSHCWEISGIYTHPLTVPLHARLLVGVSDGVPRCTRLVALTSMEDQRVSHVSASTKSHSHSSEPAGSTHDCTGTCNEPAGWLRSAKGRLKQMQSHALREYGKLVTHYPWRFIVPSIVIALLLGLGWLRFEIESDTKELWIPQNSETRQRESTWLKHFNSSDFATFIVEDRRGDHGVLTPWNVDKLFDLHEQAIGALDSSCNDSGCVSSIRGLLSLWCSREEFNATVMSQPDPQLALQKQITNTEVDCSGASIMPESMCSGALRNSDELIAKCEALHMMYKLITLTEQGAHDFRAAMSTQASQTDFHLVYQDSNSINDAARESVTSEPGLIVASFSLLFVFLAMLQQRRHLLHSRPLLSLVAVGVILLSLIASYGALLISLPFTSLQALLPFIIVGVGIDDAILLLESTRRARVQCEDLGLEDQMSQVVEEAGMSVITTSATDVMAFMLGSLSLLPAITWFCYFAALGFMCIMILMLTVFLPAVSIVEARVRARVDTLAAEEAGGDEEVGKKSSKQLHESERAEHQIGQHIAGWVAQKVLMRTPVRVVSICVGIALTVLFASKAKHIDRGLPVSQLAPQGSYVREYAKTSGRTFKEEIGEDIAVCFYGVSFPKPEVQVQMLEAFRELRSFSFVDREGPESSWLENAIDLALQSDELEANNCSLLASEPDLACRGQYVGSNTTVIAREHFAKAVESLVNGTGNSFTNDVALSSDRTSIDAGCLWTRMKPIGSDVSLRSKRFQAAQEAESALLSEWSERTGEDTDSLHVYGNVLIFWEQDAIIDSVLRQNLLLAGTGVAAMSFVMTQSVVGSVASTVSVAFVDVFNLGILWLRDERLNSVTVVNLVVALGLAIDYVLHFVRAFLDASGVGRERVVEAMRSVGVPIFAGGLSTLIAISPLGGSDSCIFVTFFQLLMSTVGSGLFSGLVMIPSILSFMPQRAFNV